jgi:uncharacterized protein (TIGR02453 family)
MPSPFAGFPAEGLRFLRRLERNNNRDWFRANKPAYDQKLRAPMEELVGDVGTALQGFAPELVTDPKRAIFRIYRDTRFSADKTPYKTQIAAHFSPKGGGAGLYFHVDPKHLLVAGGIYMPASDELRAIRKHIALHAAELRGILRERKLARLYGELEGDRLTRAPRDFSPDHPDLDLLRYKQFCLWYERPARLAASRELFPLLVRSFVAVMPLVRYLNRPLRSKVPLVE